MLKRVDLSESDTVDGVAEEYLRRTRMLDVRLIAEVASGEATIRELFCQQMQRASASAPDIKDVDAVLQSGC